MWLTDKALVEVLGDRVLQKVRY